MQMRSSSERQHLVSRVKALAEALENTGISELELTESGTHIVIRRQLDAPSAVMPVNGARAKPRVAVSRQALSDSAPAAPALDAGIPVTAPLTGVYYESPSPSSPPFVQVGGTVQAGQIVCIMEAMKVFNEIKAEISGIVTAILPQNGQLVQKGDPLVRIRPA